MNYIHEDLGEPSRQNSVDKPVQFFKATGPIGDSAQLNKTIIKTPTDPKYLQPSKQQSLLLNPLPVSD